MAKKSNEEKELLVAVLIATMLAIMFVTLLVEALKR